MTFTVKTGEAEPISEQWSEGSPLPTALSQMSFLDTANARPYIEDRTEILFLPPEVRCLTTLGQLYGLAAQICQERADGLTQQYGGQVGLQFDSDTPAGAVVALLTTTTQLDELPSAEQVREAGTWDDSAAALLAQTRLQIAQGPTRQARTLRRLGETAKAVADKAVAAIGPQIERDSQLLRSRAEARNAAEAFAADQAGRYPIAATGSETWRQLFLIARQFAAEAEITAVGSAFEIGDPCMLCQRPLDEAARDRLNAFNTYVAGEAAAAVDAAQKPIADRIAALRRLELDTAEQVRRALAEHRENDEGLRAVVDAAADAIQALADRKALAIAHLEGGAPIETLPDIAPIVRLSETAATLVSRAEALEQHGEDSEAPRLERELRNREALAGSLNMMLARRDGLVDRLRYIASVAALNTRPVSILASTLRSELVTPDLRQRIEREIAALDLGHIPLRFTEASESGKSFFEMALDCTTRAKKSQVLSEGEQRGLAIACFLADSHVSDSMGAIIVDDPVTSLDHQRIHRVPIRFVEEAARGRQVIIFTHNLLFYQELLRACADRDPQVPALPCLIQQSADGFGIVSIDDQPWIAKKVKQRERALEAELKAIPDDLPPDGEELRVHAKQFYTDLRETWERAVEEVVLGGVVERFGTDVKTQSLKLVDIDDNDYRTIFFVMKRASERSGHDQAAAKQIDPPEKKQMELDLLELRAFIATHRKKAETASVRRKAVEEPPKASVA